MNSRKISSGVNPDALYANALSLIPEIGPARLRSLRAYFSNFEEAWRGSASDLARAGLDSKTIQTLLTHRPLIDPETEMQKLERANVQLLLEEDAEYPELLHNMAAPPQTLYIQGTLSSIDMPRVGIVGTRHPTSYGIEACGTLSRKLTEAGLAIVSGMAIGIDTMAHRACLDAGGVTLAVVGSGLGSNVIYPSSNRKLAERIAASGGAVISEYPLEMKAAQWTFPLRNRIIAALSQGTIVVEAKKKSGALITAAFALEFGKEVFAVPGPIFSDNSEGPHALLRQGAALATCADDVLYALGISHEPAESAADHRVNLSTEAALVLSFLIEPKTPSDIVQESGKDAAFVNQTLSLMEIHGIIKRTPEGTYRKIN